MTSEEQARIFHEFTRLRSAQGQEGFGLGLSITRKLVELLKGDIHIQSSPGKGSVFHISFPLPLAQTIRPETTDPIRLHADRQAHILLIDDDRIQLNLTEAMFRNLFAHLPASQIPFIHCCTRPEELFRLLQSEPVDLILTDIQMPVMNGFELLKEIRKQDTPQAHTVPVIAITARSDMSETDFHTQGFAGCLYKPFNQQELLKICQHTLHTDWQTTPVPTKQLPDTSIEKRFNFNPLTAFSEDDPEAARQIMNTFLAETQKNREHILQILENGTVRQLGEIAHKMLPTFTMIEARHALPSLLWLETHRGDTTWSEETRTHADNLLKCIDEVMEEAKRFTT